MLLHSEVILIPDPIVFVASFAQIVLIPLIIMFIVAKQSIAFFLID